MYHRVLQSKYRQEIITLVWDFSEQLVPGDSIFAVTLVEILVSSGDDANPSDLIKGLPLVTGTVVQQRIRRGIPGTIYTVTIWIQTTAGNILEDLCYLAILPRLDFNPPIWETTQLYPIDAQDAMQGGSFLVGGRFSVSYAIPPEAIKGFNILQSGSLLQQLFITYNIPPEAIQGLTLLVSGHLVSTNYVTYHVGHEDIKGFSVPVSGHLIRLALPYEIPHEDIQGFNELRSGHLA